jgi:hypothetical protein
VCSCDRVRACVRACACVCACVHRAWARFSSASASSGTASRSLPSCLCTSTDRHRLIPPGLDAVQQQQAQKHLDRRSIDLSPHDECFFCFFSCCSSLVVFCCGVVCNQIRYQWKAVGENFRLNGATAPPLAGAATAAAAAAAAAMALPALLSAVADGWWQC